MITETGKNILAKYLIGQAPAYASYIAIGCGSRPLDPGAPIQDYTQKELLDFEMFRVPIVSRGYVTELDNNDEPVSKVVFTAELPTEERYEITEIGVYSAASNPSALNTDSRTLFSFNDQNELWEYHTQVSATAIPPKYAPLDTGVGNDTIGVPEPVFNVNSDNEIFTNPGRLTRNEVPRFLNNSLAIIGNDADLSLNKKTITGVSANGTQIVFTTQGQNDLEVGNKVNISGVLPAQFNLINATVSAVSNPTGGPYTFTVASSVIGNYSSGGFVERILGDVNYTISQNSNHVHLTGISLNLDKNSPKDLLKLAFSLVTKDGISEAIPDSVRLIVEFASTELGDKEVAKLEAIVYHNPTTGALNNFEENRYFVVSQELQDLLKSPSYTWASVEVVKIYASVYKDGQASDDFYVFLDGLRFENITNTNPLYGMTGYSVIRNQEAKPILKLANTNNFVEFRFALDVM